MNISPLLKLNFIRGMHYKFYLYLRIIPSHRTLDHMSYDIATFYKKRTLPFANPSQKLPLAGDTRLPKRLKSSLFETPQPAKAGFQLLRRALVRSLLLRAAYGDMRELIVFPEQKFNVRWLALTY